MGALWLPDLDDWHRAADLDTEVWPDWLTRSRSSGGYDDIFGLGIHHDASSTSTSLIGASTYGFSTAPYAPVGAIRVDRGSSGKIMVGAAGATNTQGAGGPLRCSRGTIPADSGNRYVISWEPLNNGVGEPWSPTQQTAYARSVAAVIVGLRDHGAYDAYNRRQKRIELNPLAMDVHAHFEWTTRKIDPAGPSQWADTADRYLRWKMDQFRASVAAQVADISGTPTPPPPGGPVTVITQLNLPTDGDWERMYDSRPDQPAYHNPTTPKTRLQPGETRKVATAMAHAAQVRVTCVNASAPGHLIANGQPGGQNPVVNYGPGDADYDTRWVALPDGNLYVSCVGGAVDFIVDVSGTGE